VQGIASFANRTLHQHELEELYEASLHILDAVEDFLKADLDRRTTQRPWRLLYLTHCIIAIRTGNGGLARLSYDWLIEYLPEKTEAFFNLGMQKVRDGQYSLHCRNTMQAYCYMYGSDNWFGTAANTSPN
jgi:hypothetical protein